MGIYLDFAPCDFSLLGSLAGGGVVIILRRRFLHAFNPRGLGFVIFSHMKKIIKTYQKLEKFS